MFVNVQTGHGLWHYSSSKMKAERAAALENYANTVLKPLLQDFPELVGKIHLSLGPTGFIYRRHPILEIVVQDTYDDCYPRERARFITAHILADFVQFLNGTEAFGQVRDNAYMGRSATFLALARGYTYDFLKSFQTGCAKPTCDFRYKFCFFKCKDVFSAPCRCYDENYLKTFSDALVKATSACHFSDTICFADVIHQVEKDSALP